MLIYTNQGFSIMLPLVGDQTAALTVGRRELLCREHRHWLEFISFSPNR